ncbi:branched-chain alpha-ketoacid dehydrogenase kinase [Dipodascopsis tothii]|uniref:branched-chain alpha-ketoacid dehydrogenase kinase n=1 Tax=Dipodascopsis tothii TaxID=44089 RepID=UPI0034CFE097
MSQNPFKLPIYSGRPANVISLDRFCITSTHPTAYEDKGETTTNKMLCRKLRWEQLCRGSARKQGLSRTSRRYSSDSENYVSTASSRHFYQNSALLDYVSRKARPVSLQQLMFYGAKLTDEKIIASANFVHQEIPVRIAHRIHDMQSLPYVVVSNKHISNVYNLYYQSFHALRKFPIIRTMEDNSRFCDLLNSLLTSHLSVIPNLVMGVIECADKIEYKRTDDFMKKMLTSRISRRVIQEQHIALTDLYLNKNISRPQGQIGKLYLQLTCGDVVRQCAKLSASLSNSLHPNHPVPEVLIDGHENTKISYIESHLHYILGEILRNSFEAAIEKYDQELQKPITVTISDSPVHVIFRFSDRSGGLPGDIMPYLWSFVKGPRSQTRLKNFQQVPALAAIVEELHGGDQSVLHPEGQKTSSLSGLTTRSPAIRLGMGLPMSRTYAEYWGGKLDVHSLEGYGCDVFLHISKYGTELKTT